MGIALPPNEPGSLCNRCFGALGPFSGPTPKYVTARIQGVEAGFKFPQLLGPLPNGSFILKQIAACGWRYIGDDIIMELGWTGASTVFVASDRSLLTTFFADPFQATCSDSFDNSLSPWAMWAAINGSCNISWSL